MAPDRPRTSSRTPAHSGRRQSLRARGNRSNGQPQGRQAGQSLVEFSLILPLFLLLFMGTLEFGFVLNAVLNVNFASRNAALLAAEAGDSDGADCVILESVENDVTAPAGPQSVESVEIYWAEADGDIKAGAVNVYERTGFTTCTYRDGSMVTVPYTATLIGYADWTRCNVLKGCGGSHTTVDTVGVKITYRHVLNTPMAGLLGGLGTFQFARASAMRMEAIL